MLACRSRLGCATQMNDLALFFLILVTLAIMVHGLRKRSGVIQFPFLAAAVCGGWFIPQAIGLVDDMTLPDGGYALTMFYAAACLAAIWLGYRPRVVRRVIHQEFDDRRLLVAAAGLSLIGGAAYSQILDTPVQQNELGLTTGIVTVYFFFSKLQYFGLALALLLLLRRFSLPALALVIIDLNMILGFVLFGGRRGPAIEVAMIVMASLWFQRRLAPPRTVVLAMVLVAATFGNSISSYRQIIAEINAYQNAGEEIRLPTIDEVLDIQFMDDFRTLLDKGSYEATNAVYSIAASSETFSFSFGIEYWNYLVFSYVPAQFVGRDIKDAMTFEQPDLRLQAYRYVGHIGMTDTGFADSFEAFWVLGVLVFFLISRLLSQWWSLAMGGALLYQFLYAITITSAMHSITHSTRWLIAFLPYALGVWWAVSKWAGKQGKAKAPDLRVEAPNH